ncbi:MAG: hypothetical protein PVF58_08385 [Candidatus Methanofastidiosia archaeon]|jgi:hypothetical protein
MEPTEKLIFVYNADSGLINEFSDYVHKIVSPLTYPCNLCALTFGNFGMKDEWKHFIENLDIAVEFYHKDEFLKKYKKTDQFPSVFIENEHLKLFISQKEMNALETLDELMDLVKKKLS